MTKTDAPGGPQEEVESLSDKAPIFYSNQCSFAASVTDVALSFSRQIPKPDPEPELQTIVLMAWEQAKVLHEMLEKALTAYENDMGPVRDLVDRAELKASLPEPRTPNAPDDDDEADSSPPPTSLEDG